MEPTFSESVLARNFTFKMLTAVHLGDNADKPMLNYNPWSIFDNAATMSGKVVISICDPKLFLTDAARSVTLWTQADFVKQYWNQKPSFHTNPNLKYHNGAWVFGRQNLPFKDYLYQGVVDNDIYLSIVVCSLVDMTKKSWLDWTSQDWIDCDLRNISPSTIHDKYPAIWWMDENPAHGVGAYVFIHENESKQIDSIIIDNWYFEPPSKIIEGSYFYLHDEKDDQPKTKLFKFD